MNYKGAYSDATEYGAGDVVVYDGVAYMATKTVASGATPHDKLYWERVPRPLQDVVIMFHGYFEQVKASIPDNISDDAILLAADDDNDYIITVDTTGDTPELSVALVEEEGEET